MNRQDLGQVLTPTSLVSEVQEFRAAVANPQRSADEIRRAYGLIVNHAGNLNPHAPGFEWATPAHSKPGACGFRLPAWLTINPYARLISSALRCGLATAARNSCTSDTKLVGVSTCPRSCLFIAILSLLRT